MSSYSPSMRVATLNLALALLGLTQLNVSHTALASIAPLVAPQNAITGPLNGPPNVAPLDVRAEARGEGRERVLTLRTTEGVAVDVYESELRAASAGLKSGGGANVGFANEDGSVTFKRPRVFHNGEWNRVAGDFNSAMGFCKLRGFDFEVLHKSREQNEGEHLLVLSSAGRVKSAITADPMFNRAVYESITCSEHASGTKQNDSNSPQIARKEAR